MRAALERHLRDAGGGCRWQVPTGGMFFWVDVPEGSMPLTLLPRAVARGMAFVPGAAFYAADAAQDNTLRLSVRHGVAGADRAGRGAAGRDLEGEGRMIVTSAYRFLSSMSSPPPPSGAMPLAVVHDALKA